MEQKRPVTILLHLDVDADTDIEDADFATLLAEMWATRRRTIHADDDWVNYVDHEVIHGTNWTITNTNRKG